MDPRVAVAHEDRVRPVAWYRRRVAYNESVAPLLSRHPERVPVLFLSGIAAFAWGAALGGSPAPVVVLTAVRAVRLRRALAGRLPGAGAWAVRAAVDITVREARDLGRALAGPWAPFALAALAASPAPRRRRLALRLAAPIATMAVRLAGRPSGARSAELRRAARSPTNRAAASGSGWGACAPATSGRSCPAARRQRAGANPQPPGVRGGS